MSKVIPIIFLSLFVFGTSLAQNKRAALDKYFSTLAKNQRLNGNVLVAENGNIVYQKSFGYADFGNKRLNTYSSTFPIMSITKTFTSTAILQLKEQGKLKVTDFVAAYLPHFPYPNITITHLLSHTSGLRPYDDYFDSLHHVYPDSVFTNKDILPKYATVQLPLLFQPGEKFYYDNINFIFLAIIIEKLSGMPFKEYVATHIFKPAGMLHTYIPASPFYQWSREERKDMSALYRYPHLYSDRLERVDTVAFVSQYWRAYNFSGEGEIISSTGDLLKYDAALYNGTLLNQKSLDEAFTPVILNNGQINSFSSGLGWLVEEDSAMGKTVRYMGGAFGLRSHLRRNISKHQAVIIVDNTQNEIDDVAGNALKILNGQMIKPTGKSLAKKYGRLLVDKGATVANTALQQLKNDTLSYSIDENEFNSLGYDFIANDKMKEALLTFKQTISLFQTSWNAYDSYGEALLKNGYKEKAIVMYKKSVELNPGNEGGKKVLEELSK